MSSVLTRFRRLRDDRRDAGISMVELLVVIVVLGVVMGMVQGVVLMAHRTNDGVTGRLASSSEAQVAMDALSKNLRTAVLPQLVAGATCDGCASMAFVQGTPTSVQFYANNNNDQSRLGPSKVTYTLSDGVLTETQQKPDPHAPTVFTYTYCTPGPGCAVSQRVLARNVTGDRIFTYYDRAGNAMDGTLDDSELSRVDSIDVSVQVKSHANVTCTTSSAKCTTLVQRVTLPNADTIPEVTTTATATASTTPTPTSTSTRTWGGPGGGRR